MNTKPRVQNKNVWPFDIGVVGLGIVGSHQLTREVSEVITRCKQTFVIESGFGVEEYLKTLCPKVINLGSLYERGKSRLPTYRKMAAKVVSAALTDPPVCLAAYGHPLVYCYPTTLVKRAASLLNLHVEVFAGVSAFDTLLVDLGIDVALAGLQMYEATDILLRRRPIQNDAACVIWQATVVGDPTYPERPLEAEHFQPLQNYLMQFYAAAHEVVLVASKNFPLGRSVVRRFPLKRLAVELKIGPPVATLFIPPAFTRPIRDEALLKKMLAASGGRPAGVQSTRRHKPTPVANRSERPVIGPQPPKRSSGARHNAKK